MTDLAQIITKSKSILSTESYKHPKCFKYQLNCKDRGEMKTWKVGLVRAALVSTIKRMKKNVGIIKNVQSVKNGIIAYIAESFTVIHIKVRKVNASFTPVCAPSEVVITNIHPMTSNEALERVASQLGTVSNFRRNEKRNHVAVLKFSSYISEEIKQELCEIRYSHRGEPHTLRLRWKKPHNNDFRRTKKKKTEEQLEKDDQIDEIMEEAEGSGKSDEVEEKVEAGSDSSIDKLSDEEEGFCDLPDLEDFSDVSEDGAVNLDVIEGFQDDGILHEDSQPCDERLEMLDSKQTKFAKRKHKKTFQKYIENSADLLSCPDWILMDEKQALLQELPTEDLELLALQAKSMYDNKIGYEDTDERNDILLEMERELIEVITGKRGREHKTKKASLTPPQPKRICERNKKEIQKSHNKIKTEPGLGKHEYDPYEVQNRLKAEPI